MVFRRKIFVSQCRKLSQGDPIVLCFRKLLVANKIMFERGRGSIKIFRRNFFVPQCRKLSQGNPFVLCCVSEKFRQRNRLWIRKGVSRSSVERIFVSECRTFRRGTISVLCFRNVPVARNSMDKIGGYQDFPSTFFVSQRRKHWQGNPFVSFFGKLLVANKIMDERGRGGIKIFRRQFFVPQCQKLFAREPYCGVFQKNSGSAKDCGLERWVSRSSVERFFVSECRKFRGGKILCSVSGNFRWRKTLWIRDGALILFCTTTPKTLAKELFCVVFRKTSGSEKDYG